MYLYQIKGNNNNNVWNKHVSYFSFTAISGYLQEIKDKGFISLYKWLFGVEDDLCWDIYNNGLHNIILINKYLFNLKKNKIFISEMNMYVFTFFHIFSIFNILDLCIGFLFPEMYLPHHDNLLENTMHYWQNSCMGQTMFSYFILDMYPSTESEQF